MDIAEIRKKAKAQASTEAPVQKVAEQPDAVQEQDTFVLQDETVDAVEDLSSVAVAEYEVSDSPEVSEGLDRLFAASEEFVLATDDSYADILDKQAADQSQASQQYLAFHLGDEEYALDIKQISEIIKVREFTDIPRAPEFILGIISLRGVVVPIYDLRRRLNLGGAEMMATSRIVVCRVDDISVGLLVDSINQVVNLVDKELEPPPGVLSGLDREMVAGIGRYQGRMIILLNVHSVLDVALD